MDVVDAPVVVEQMGPAAVLLCHRLQIQNSLQNN